MQAAANKLGTENEHALNTHYTRVMLESDHRGSKGKESK